jgi:hypothetical protein
MRLQRAIVVAALALAGAASAQILPKDAATPVEVRGGKGEFARRLNGAVMGMGKGWKAVLDPQKRVQIMVPDAWKPEAGESDEVVRVLPPGGKDAKAVLLVILSEPRDADPLEIKEDWAVAYADALADEPMLKKLKFQPTDAGFVLARGLKFALAGGTVQNGKSDLFQQEQLIYIAEDRIVTVQFTCRAADFPRYAPDLARVFASYQTIGRRKLVDE